MNIALGLALLTTCLSVADAVVTTRATSRRLDRLERAVDPDGIERLARDAQRARSARAVELRSMDRRLVVHAVVTEDGRGYVLDGNLPRLAAGRTYQLWALADTAEISVANIGRTIDVAAFNTPTAAWGLAITVESTPGVTSSANQPLVIDRLDAEGTS